MENDKLYVPQHVYNVLEAWMKGSSGKYVKDKLLGLNGVALRVDGEIVDFYTVEDIQGIIDGQHWMMIYNPHHHNETVDSFSQKIASILNHEDPQNR